MPKPKLKAEEVGSMKKFKKGLKRKNNQFLKRIPEDGLNVRFLTEPDQWVKYKEHYDEDHEPRYFPCVQGVCEGCQNLTDYPSERYLTNALDIDSEEVVPLVIPKSLAKDLEGKYNRNQTIMDRDYELNKEGSGFDTTYSSYNEGPNKRRIDGLEMFDLLDVLASQLEADDEDLDEDDDIDDDDDQPPKRKSMGAKRRRAVEEDDDDDSDVARPRKRVAKKKPAKAVAKKRVAKKSVAKRPAKKTVAKKRGLSK